MLIRFHGSICLGDNLCYDIKANWIVQKYTFFSVKCIRFQLNCKIISTLRRRWGVSTFVCCETEAKIACQEFGGRENVHVKTPNMVYPNYTKDTWLTKWFPHDDEYVQHEATTSQHVNLFWGGCTCDEKFRVLTETTQSFGRRGRKVPRLYVTRVGGINPEALVPKTAQKDEAVVGRDDETLRADLNALIQQVWDLTTMAAHVAGWGGRKNERRMLKIFQHS